MASLSEAKKLIDNNTRFIVKLLTSVPERLASNEIIMRHSYEERIFLMSREEMNSFVIGEAVSINNDLKLINYQFGKSKNIDIDDDERDFTVEITYIPFIFLGAREIIDE